MWMRIVLSILAAFAPALIFAFAKQGLIAALLMAPPSVFAREIKATFLTGFRIGSYATATVFLWLTYSLLTDLTQATLFLGVQIIALIVVWEIRARQRRTCNNDWHFQGSPGSQCDRQQSKNKETSC